jgi:hypothetical protein
MKGFSAPSVFCDPSQSAAINMAMSGSIQRIARLCQNDFGYGYGCAGDDISCRSSTRRKQCEFESFSHIPFVSGSFECGVAVRLVVYTISSTGLAGIAVRLDVITGNTNNPDFIDYICYDPTRPNRSPPLPALVDFNTEVFGVGAGLYGCAENIPQPPSPSNFPSLNLLGDYSSGQISFSPLP